MSYVFDSLGVIPANYIVNEPHVVNGINGIDHNYFIPRAAPFFAGEGRCVITDASTGLALVENEDFYFGLRYADGTLNIGTPIAGAIVFINPNTTGSYFINYHTVGGDLVDQTAAYIADGLDTLDALVNRDWSEVANVPSVFPATAHMQRVDEVEGYNAFLSKLMALSEAVAAPKKIVLNDITDFDSAYVTPMLEALGAIAVAVENFSLEQNTLSLYDSLVDSDSSTDIDDPIGTVWYDTGISLTITSSGVYRIDMTGSPVCVGATNTVPAALRWVMDDNALTNARINSSVQTIASGSIIKLQISSNTNADMDRLLLSGPVFGVGLIITKLRNLL